MDMITQEVERLDYGVVEGIITDYFEIGYINSSSLPNELAENSSGTYTRKLKRYSI